MPTAAEAMQHGQGRLRVFRLTQGEGCVIWIGQHRVSDKDEASRMCFADGLRFFFGDVKHLGVHRASNSCFAHRDRSNFWMQAEVLKHVLSSGRP